MMAALEAFVTGVFDPLAIHHAQVPLGVCVALLLAGMVAAWWVSR